MDIKESDSQFEDKQTLETAITSLQKILEIIKSVNSTREQATIDEKIKPIQELISKFQKQVEVLTKKEGQKTDKKETGTTSSERERESYSSEGGSYTPTYTESNGTDTVHKRLQANHLHLIVLAAAEMMWQVHKNQAANTSEAQAETNTNSNNAGVPTTNSDDLASLGGGVTSFGQQ